MAIPKKVKKMLIGNLKIDYCNECPAYKWQGENITQGDLGYACCFGTFTQIYDQKKQIPTKCPISCADIDGPSFFKQPKEELYV